MNIYYVDGEFVPADKALIPVDDLAVIRGIGVFDLMRTYNGYPYFLKEHVSRLLHSAGEFDLKLPWTHKRICDLALETLARNHLQEANIRIIVTGGSSPDFMTPSGRPRLLVLVSPLPKLPTQWYTRGVKVITVGTSRERPDAKSIDYLQAAMALRKAKAAGAIEALYLDEAGRALEGATSNLFAFVGQNLVTPGRGMLSGITRKVILEIVKGHFAIDIRGLTYQELVAAGEVFITGTNKGLVPVVQIDTHAIGTGEPGPRTREIMSLLKRHASRRSS